MPLVRRAEYDMFRLAPIVDVMVNATNCQGAMGKGIAKEFRDRHPMMYRSYKSRCEAGEIRIGGPLHYFKDTTVSYGILNVPTKNMWQDPSDVEELRKSLRTMRQWLQKDDRQLLTVAMPMLGCGEGRVGYEVAEPMFFDYLDDLDNVIHLSMLPEKMDHIPKYLAIIGPRVYYDEADIRAGVEKALVEWGLKWTDFDAIVSGGATGVDQIACGLDRNDPTALTSLAIRFNKKPPIICKADWNRYGKRAGFLRNRTVIDIATHVVAILPKGVVSVGTPMAIDLVNAHNEKCANDPDKGTSRYIDRIKKLYIHGSLDDIVRKKSVRL